MVTENPISGTLKALPSGTEMRPAIDADLASLVLVEQACFSNDRLSRRRFRHWIHASNGALQVLRVNGKFAGYALILLNHGTRLARLYSLAILPDFRGQGIAQLLLQEMERIATEHDRLYMRLEVSQHNASAIKLYEQMGYRAFGEYSDYYEDHSNALRMQKCIRQRSQTSLVQNIPWHRQTTEFTCGPAALMMAMASQTDEMPMSQELELDLWREATTIFMTSGHGGCHPLGLGIAARKRGFNTRVYLNTDAPLFIEGVRSEHKKSIMLVADEQFNRRAREAGVTLMYQDVTQADIQQCLHEGWAVLVLISTYRLDGKKAPHWVTVTGMDDQCFYLHDPDLDENQKHPLPMDYQHVPIARDDFAKMSLFGRGRLRTAIAIRYE